MTGLIRPLILATVTSISLSPTQYAFGQTDASGPLFSTPASRSTTGAPILSDPTKDSNGIIGSAGGGSARQSAPAPAQQPAKATPKPFRDGSSGPAEMFGNWELQCEAKQCQVTGKATSADQTQTILVMSIARDGDGSSVAFQAALPLGIAVQKPVTITVESGFKSDLLVSRCTPQGCLIEGSADSELIEAFKKGTEAQFTVTTPEGQAIPIKLSLDGFAKALDRL